MGRFDLFSGDSSVMVGVSAGSTYDTSCYLHEIKYHGISQQLLLRDTAVQITDMLSGW